ncbi:ATP-binding cassette domain-containing protein [Paracoccus caeni]|uniref:ATP-binding cassette domain-containing protein n=1 Tax=Paracoccus caeni TaxID=657651 RepID=A0A934W272_9RHOB|nr:taurine ABC transporter ATP-binding protein [Paracoccus caeni]MBK4217484.1 ATP-binding cassette domain-containing protein [Paracoccus caeni]
MSSLNLAGVSLHYGPEQTGLPVLQNVSLNLARGEFISVIGRSGSGKTSLLNLAGGFVAPSAGRVTVDGKPVTGPGPDRAVVFQDDALYPWRSVRDNVALPLKLRGIDAATRAEKAREWLAAVGLQDHQDKHVWQLSGGQRQRVGLARALASEPEFLLMDEPLGALDAMTRDQMHELLLSLWEESHAGALLITHSVEEAVFLSTSVIVLAPTPGRIVHREEFEFGRRYLEGEDPRALKSEPEFIDARERLLAAIYEKELVDG